MKHIIIKLKNLLYSGLDCINCFYKTVLKFLALIEYHNKKLQSKEKLKVIKYKIV